MKKEHNERVKIMVVEPGEKPYIVKILKNEYGVEMVLRGPSTIEGIDKNNVALIYNEEADKRGLAPNRLINRNGTGKAIRGVIILYGVKNGKLCDFPEELIEEYLVKFNETEIDL